MRPLSPMKKLEEYRANAAECQRMAEQTENVADKAAWLDMAGRKPMRHAVTLIRGYL